MPEYTVVLILFLTGCLGGFFSGLLGIGGGIIFIPVLSHYFTSIGITDPDLTRCFLANSFFAIIFSGISGSFKQYRLKRFYPKQVFTTAIGAILASLFFSWLIGQGHWYSKERFMVFFILVLLILNYRLFSQRKQDSGAPIEGVAMNRFVYSGLIAGTFAAFSGLGGGFIMVMLFVQWMRLDIKLASAISTGTIPFISMPLVVFYMLQHPIAIPMGHLHIGYILPLDLLPMIAGVMICSPFGVMVATKVSQQTIKLSFIAFSMAIILKMAFDLI